ncbi:MAG: helix-turn-helix transcriptional regulator [Bdellovibrionota bacterium]
MKLAVKLKQLRVQKSWSLATTARSLGVPASTYKEWELGRKIPVDQLVNLAGLHSTSVSNLLGQKQISNEELAKGLLALEAAMIHVKKAISHL